MKDRMRERKKDRKKEGKSIETRQRYRVYLTIVCMWVYLTLH